LPKYLRYTGALKNQSCYLFMYSLS